MKDNSISDIMKLIIKASLIGIAGFFFPVIYMVFPAIFLTESLKSGIVRAMGAFIAVCILIGILMDPIVGIGVFTLFGPMILLYNYLIMRNADVDTSILLVAVLFFLGAVLFAYALGITPEVLKSQSSINEYIKMQKQLFSQTNENLQMLNATLTEIYNRTLQLIPAGLLILSLVISYVTYSITGRNLLRVNLLVKQPSSFVFFRLPKGLFLSAILAATFIFLLKDYIGDFRIIMDNIVIVYTALLFTQGLSILKFFMVKAKFGKFFQTFLVVFALFIPGVQMFFAFVGILDFVLNFRKLPS